MSTVDAPENPVAPGNADSVPPTRRFDSRKIAVVATVVLVAALVVGGVIAQGGKTDLRIFDSASAGYTVSVPYGGSAFVGGFAVSPAASERNPASQIIIDSAKPVLAANSGPAQVHLLVCKGALGGGDEALVRKVCSTVTNALGTSWRTDGRQGDLIVQVKPTSRKGVDFRGFIVTYHQGNRSGTQLAGPTAVVTVK
jgi:hypothetical protein